jgi:AAA family ATP:ADP antiporter
MSTSGDRATTRARGEVVFASLMCAVFFLTITTFWVMKPLKKGLLIRSYDAAGLDLGPWHLASAEVELVAKAGNVALAAAAALAFAALARRLRRHRLLIALALGFAAAHVAFAFALRAPGAAAAWAFYWYGDLWTTLMVVAFFAFLNDSVSPDEAKRLYGPIGVGGVLGGVAGATGVAALLERMDASAWLVLCAGATLLIAALAAAAGRQVPPSAAVAPAPGPGGAGGALRAVARSRYLLAIVAIVACYEVASTLLDFQFTSTVARTLDGPAIDRRFAAVFAVTNGAALAVQVAATPLVLTRLGVGAGLLVLPGAALAAQAGFAAAPALGTASALSVVDNSLNYSLQQSAREALYVPTTREEKYQAKAVIDMFVQRFAKLAAIGIALAAAAWLGKDGDLRWLALPAAAVLVVWIAVARYAGARFEALAEGASR